MNFLRRDIGKHGSERLLWQSDLPNLESKDEPGDWTFEWEPVAEQGSTAVVEGRTVYRAGRSYRNIWVVELAPDGRATRFTEWYMEEPADQDEDG